MPGGYESCCGVDVVIEAADATKPVACHAAIDMRTVKVAATNRPADRILIFIPVVAIHLHLPILEQVTLVDGPGMWFEPHLKGLYRLRFDVVRIAPNQRECFRHVDLVNAADRPCCWPCYNIR